MAEFNLVKTRYGFEFATDEDFECANNKFKVGDMIKADIPLKRNWVYHKKMFRFFEFCFSYWCTDIGKTEFMTNRAQKKEHRNNLTIIAGYYEEVYDIKGNLRLRAKSLSYESMEQDEFEECCNAMINAALRTTFKDVTDENIINQLYSYF